MKNFKNLLIIVVLCAIGSMNAKQMNGQNNMPSQPRIQPYEPALPETPAYNIPSNNVTASPEKNANATIEAELAKIEKIQNNIKSSALNILNDAKINESRKRNFMRNVESTYQVIIDSCQEDLTELRDILRLR
jgi:hypothetical protein